MQGFLKMTVGTILWTIYLENNSYNEICGQMVIPPRPKDHQTKLQYHSREALF